MAGPAGAKQTIPVTSVLERLLPLWAQPVDARPDPVAAFGEVYADPVLVNGTELALADLVDEFGLLRQLTEIKLA